MKNIFKIFIAISLVWLSGCEKISPELGMDAIAETDTSVSNEEDWVDIVVTATTESSTKVDINHTSISWNEGDCIYLINKRDGAEFGQCLMLYIEPTSISEDGKTASFYGRGAVSASDTYFAVSASSCSSQSSQISIATKTVLTQLASGTTDHISDGWFMCSNEFTMEEGVSPSISFVNQGSIMSLNLTLDPSILESVDLSSISVIFTAPTDCFATAWSIDNDLNISTTSSAKYYNVVVSQGVVSSNESFNVKFPMYWNENITQIDGEFKLYFITSDMQEYSATIPSSVLSGGGIYATDLTLSVAEVTGTYVSTLAGSYGALNTLDGTLSSAEFYLPRYLCVDADKNIFVSDCWGNVFRRVNEEQDIVTTIQKGGTLSYPNLPTCDVEGKRVFVPNDSGNAFLEYNPENDWAPEYFSITQAEDDEIGFEINWKHSLAANPEDGLIYTRAYNGQLIKFNPDTKVGWRVGTELYNSSSDAYLAFHPTNPNELYISYCSRNLIYKMNVETLEHTLYAGQGNGYADGDRLEAQFYYPRQITFTADGTMYIADSYNHCIRSISPDGLVSTVIGLPGISGYSDGTSDTALFNQPNGIAVDSDDVLYVADMWNSVIRKLTLEPEDVIYGQLGDLEDRGF